MRRREFLGALGGAAVAWPLAARAQQQPIPVIGLLDPRSPDDFSYVLRAFRQGLKDVGYVEGENVAINTASLRISSIDCQRWPPIWFVGGSP